MKLSKYINPLFAFVMLVIFSLSCESEKQANNNISGTEANKIQTVEVVTPQKRSFQSERLITGSAQANKKVMLYAMESGYVEVIRKDIGDVVREGEVIAILKNPELNRQQENVNAKLEAKKAIYERLNSVYKKTPALTSIQLVENAKADYLSARAEAKGIVDRLNFLKVKAPFSGIVTQRFIDNGALVQSGLTQSDPQGIVEIQQMNPIRLTLPLPESDITIIKKGTQVSVTFPELPGSTLNAKVSRTSEALDLASKTMRVEIDLDNSEGSIKPGMYAKVAIQINSSNSVPSLPVTAQVMFQDKPYLYTVTNDIINRIPLQKGLGNKDYFEVLNTDISEKTLVVVSGKNLVKHGQTVKAIQKSE